MRTMLKESGKIYELFLTAESLEEASCLTRLALQSKVVGIQADVTVSSNGSFELWARFEKAEQKKWDNTIEVGSRRIR